jgi:hypothetical protein
MAEPRYPGTPGWVKVFAIVSLAVVIVVAVLLVGMALGLHNMGGHGQAH